jgi:hypothetical protein
MVVTPAQAARAATWNVGDTCGLTIAAASTITGGWNRILPRISSRDANKRQALAIIDDVVEGKLAAYELAIIRGIPEVSIKVTLGHVTRMVQGTGSALPLDAGGWYTFQGHEQ